MNGWQRMRAIFRSAPAAGPKRAMRRRRARRGTRSGISAIGGFRVRSGKPKHGLPYHVKEWLRFSRRVRVSRPFPVAGDFRSEEHTSELQSLLRISYAVFCLITQTNIIYNHTTTYLLIYNSNLSILHNIDQI